MQSFKSILVDIDATASVHPALERAVRLARKCGARLTIIDVMTVPTYARRYLPTEVEEEMVGRRREQLANVARGLLGVPSESKLLIGRPATVIIQEILRSQHDLLMRSHARDVAVSGSKPFGAIDMELLRKCPCPVFLVRPGGEGRTPQILGTVNTNTDDAAEQALNTKIVELTLLMALLEEGSPILLQAWAPFAEGTVGLHVSADAFAAYVEDARRHTAGDLETFAASFGSRLADVQTILRRGEPEEVIPEFTVAQAIDLVVMGAVGRAGIAGMLIGNTAERVVRKLPCSVLAVKPDGFVCPVHLDAE